jgi:hypothetical protein
MILARTVAAPAAVLWFAAAVADPPAKPPVPDFTQGGTVGAGRDWKLGPTGARGWVYPWRGHTREVLPRLEELRREFAAGHRGRGSNESVLQIDQAIAAIEASTAMPALVSRVDFKPRR